ncbi:MAG: hypothetical protein H0W76_28510 [Pyrinomonadaceae bacterium]|nr:hypothetical protein [Pyrinomonadaceae bacterium]
MTLLFSSKGAEESCRLKGYVATMRKQGRGVMETMKSMFAGKRIMPMLGWSA